MATIPVKYLEFKAKGIMATSERPADKDGSFKRAETAFRDTISSKPEAKFPAEKGRYTLFAAYGCPWAHRALIVRELKGLQDIIAVRLAEDMVRPGGWYFSEETSQQLGGAKYMKDIYHRAEPEYNGRFSVPVLFDEKTQKIVNNESSEIIRMLYDQFDDLIPEHLREASKGEAALYPSHLQSQIDEMNEWVYDTVNNGVYKVGFATKQEPHTTNVKALFASLDRLEKHLNDPAHQPYLFGEHITDADIRLYTTLARFDVAYHTIFRCNLKMIRHDYPNLYMWLRQLYWDESEKTNGGAFKNTTIWNKVSFRSYNPVS